mmetsp:Transcript_18319/g.16196  ORF Transcript_18319/g.16196 Transcript_18319/m.16196 type:complete len:157 (+) Transcript_18319:809-1279(+)
MEFEYFHESVIDAILKKSKILGNVEQYLIDEILIFLRKYSPFDFVNVIVMNFPSPRLDFYKQADYNKLQSLQLSYATALETQLGYYPVEVELPLLKQMEQFNFAILFLGLVFSIILTMFVIISIILIYSILLVNIEKKSSDIKIKRMLGLSRWSLA